MPCVEPADPTHQKNSFWWLEWSYLEYTFESEETWLEPGLWLGSPDGCECALEEHGPMECWQVLGVSQDESHNLKAVKVHGPAKMPKAVVTRKVQLQLEKG